MKIYIPALFLLFQLPFTCNHATGFSASATMKEAKQKLNSNKPVQANVVFRSADGGQTWQDLSQELPENWQQDGFFTNGNGLYLRAGNAIYRSKPSSETAFWEKETLPDKQTIIPGNTGIYTYNHAGQLLEKKNGTGNWRPVYRNFQQKGANMVFETTRGTIFIAAHNRLFKSPDGGKTWRLLQTGGPVGKLIESNGVLLAPGMRGILLSADDGENWKWVIRDGGVGINVEKIKGGFAAITFDTLFKIRRVRASYDGGKTWRSIDGGLPGQVFTASFWPNRGSDLPPKAFITSIVQVGENFFCGHPDGIFRSSDKGKTWELLLPSIGDRIFNLHVSGNVVYATLRNRGC